MGRWTKLLGGSDDHGRVPFDLEARGSRYTLQMAIAVPPGGMWMGRAERQETNVARNAVEDVLGQGWLAGEGALDPPEVFDGSAGRGAANWIPVLEWARDNALDGIAQGLAWEAAKVLYKRIKNRNEGDAPILVSRGLAANLAAIYVSEAFDLRQALLLEFAQEPSFLAGRLPTEPSFTGLEPWLISVVEEGLAARYIVAVSPHGDIQGCILLPLGEGERLYFTLPT